MTDKVARKEKSDMINILLNQGEYYVHRYKNSESHLRGLANALRNCSCVSIVPEGKKILKVTRRCKPEKMLDKIMKYDNLRQPYLDLQKRKMKHPKDQ